jgi:hypothetical protein
MADTKISAMPGAATLDGTEIVPLVQAGGNVQTTVSDFVSQTLDVNPATPAQGGTDITTYTTGDTLYASATNVLSKLAGNTTTTKKFLSQTGTGSASAAPAWSTVGAGDIVTQYGVFQNNATLTNVTPGTGMAMQFDTADIHGHGVEVVNDGAGDPTKVTIDTTGLYNFQFSAQLNKNSGGSSAIDVYIWAAIDGTAVPETNTRVTIQGPSSYTVAAWNLMLNVTAGQYFQLMWGSSDSHAEVTYIASPTMGPAVPAVILTVNRVA